MAITTFTDWLNGIDDDVDAQALAAANFEYSITPPSDPQLAADVATAKTTALALGNTKLARTLDTILTYGDKVLSILVKNGVIKNQNLLSGYNANLAALLAGTGTSGTGTTTDATSNAPAASNRVFNIDFSDPKVLIITFIVVMAIVYFLFFNSKKQHGRG